VRPLQSGSLLAVRLKAADVTAAVRFRGRIWNPPRRQLLVKKYHFSLYSLLFCGILL
jgi:hypothetical protein